MRPTHAHTLRAVRNTRPDARHGTMAPWPSRDEAPRIRPNCGIRCDDEQQLAAHAAITNTLRAEAPRGILHLSLIHI